MHELARARAALSLVRGGGRASGPAADRAGRRSRPSRARAACAASSGPALPSPPTASASRRERPQRPLPGARRGRRLHRQAGALPVKLPRRRSSRAARAALDKKAEDVRGRSTCGRSPTSPTTSCSLSGHEPEAAGRDRRRRASRRCAREGLRPAHVEGYPRQEWILLDYGDFVVHVFTPQSRVVLRPRAALGRGRAAGDRRVTTAARARRSPGWSRSRPPCRRSLRARAAPRRDAQPRAARGRERHRQGPGGPLAALRRPAARRARSSRSTARRSRASCSSRSCSATRRAPSPTRAQAKAGQDRDGRGRHALLRPGPGPGACRCRPSCCAWSRSGASSGWAGRARIEVDVRFVASANVDLGRGGARGPLPRGPLPPAERGAAASSPPLRERREDVAAPGASRSWRASASGGTTRPRRFAPRGGRAAAGLPVAGQRARAALGGRARRGARSPAGELEPRALPPQMLEQPSRALGRPRAAPHAQGRRAGLHPLRARGRRAAARRGRLRCSASAARRFGRRGAATGSRSKEKVRRTHGPEEDQGRSGRSCSRRSRRSSRPTTRTRRYGKEADGRRAGHRRQGLELLHQGVPVQPVEHRARPAAARGRGLVRIEDKRFGVCVVVRGRHEPEAPGGGALGRATASPARRSRSRACSEPAPSNLALRRRPSRGRLASTRARRRVPVGVPRLRRGSLPQPGRRAALRGRAGRRCRATAARLCRCGLPVPRGPRRLRRAAGAGSQPFAAGASLGPYEGSAADR